MSDNRGLFFVRDFPQHFHDVVNHYPTVWELIVIELCKEISVIYVDNDWPGNQTPEQVYTSVLQRIKDKGNAAT